MLLVRMDMGRYGALHNSGCIYVAVEVAVTLTLMLAICKGSRGFAPFAGDISALLAVRWFKQTEWQPPPVRQLPASL
jgi:hypothetical protein